MHRNFELYEYLKMHSVDLTEDWYNSIDDNDVKSVYSSKDPTIVTELKHKNQDYFQHVYQIFIKDDSYLYGEFRKWSENLANDPRHLNTPLQHVVREYLSCQEILLQYIKKYIMIHRQQIQIEQVFLWFEIVVKAVDISINIFIETYHKNTQGKMKAQNEMIAELSSPIILLQKQRALLPLVGDIDTTRAQIIMEQTLSQCAEKNIEFLCIDLSGVAIIDTMVAHELFNLINALRLIGVEAIISGIRPEIAQTAIQLGLTFDQLLTTASLAQALNILENR
ncbi:STAS domain-containing protein [Bacillus testis]|uniref:STAS domain-containing protein n=1 Tax=Bacillus testis TaxID=1622072 RepID=UPI00067EA431|nr:STAS domain-containing protein [Bacillus testis]